MAKSTEQRLKELEASIEIIAEQAGLKNRVTKLLPEKLKEIAEREKKNGTASKDLPVSKSKKNK